MNASTDFIRELLEETKFKIENHKRSGLSIEKCEDAYECGHRNGSFFVLVDLRRRLKEHLEGLDATPSPIPPQPPDDR